MKDKRKRIWQNNCGFWCMVALVILVPVATIAFVILNSIFSWCNIGLDDSDFYSALGIGIQIVTAIVCCGLTIIDLAISMQSNDYLGVKIKTIFDMRKKKRFSFKWSTLIAISLLALCIAGYVINQVLLCLIIACVSLCFCCYLLFTEIPFLTLQHSAIFRLVKDRFISEYNGNAKQDDYLAKDFSKLVFGIINDTEKGLNWVYERLQIKGNNDFNQMLLLRLLEIQSKKAFELPQIDSKSELIITTDKMLETVCDITNGYVDITNILGERTGDYLHLITRVLFRLLDNPVSKDKTEDRLSEMIQWCFVPEKKGFATADLYFSVVSVVIIEKIKSNDFSLANKVKAAFSTSYLSIQKTGLPARIFLMISFIMYYLAEVENEVPKETKDNIRKFIDESGVLNQTELVSWKKLFHYYSYHFAVSLSDFLSDFSKNEHYYEYYLYSGHAHWVVLSEELAIDWYLANLFNSERDMINLDFDSLLQPYKNPSRIYHLEELEKECYPNSGDVFTPSERFCKLASFYCTSEPKFTIFNIVESNTHFFKNYIQKLRKTEFEKQIKEASSESNQKIISHFQPLINEKIQSLFGFSSEIDISDEKKWQSTLISERKSDAVNFDDCIVNWALETIEYQIIDHDIKNNTHTIETGNDFETNISDLIKNEFEYITTDVQYYGNQIKATDTYSKFIERVNKAQSINDSDQNRFFNLPTILLKDGFCFNCQCEFKVLDLTPDQTSHQVDKYQRPDGQYVYQDTYFTREELTRFIQKTYVIFQCIYSYKVNTYKGGIVVLDMFHKNTILEQNSDNTIDSENE